VPEGGVEVLEGEKPGFLIYTLLLTHVSADWFLFFEVGERKPPFSLFGGTRKEYVRMLRNVS
jgi:hypothetical protein